MPQGFAKKRLILILLVLALAYAGYRFFFAHPGGPGMMGGTMPVSVAEVIEREVQRYHDFSGRLVAVDRAEIRPRVSGTIDAVHFKEGESVKKGQLLFTIDQRPYQAALQAAEARATLADAELARSKALLAEKAVPQRDFDQRKNDAEVAKADLTRAKLDYDYTLIKAPISGRVGRAEITVGNLVDAGGNAPVLTTIVSDKPIYADFDIDEKLFLDYLKQAGDDPARLNAIPAALGLAGEDGVPHEGRVQSFDNELNTQSGTIRVRTVFPNENGVLVPGLFARVRLGSVVPEKAILITDRAVVVDQNKRFVQVVGEGNKVERREVKLDGMADGLRIVSEGLKPGEKIVVSGLQRIMMPGQEVMPELVPMQDSGVGIQDSGKKKEPEPENPK